MAQALKSSKTKADQTVKGSAGYTVGCSNEGPRCLIHGHFSPEPGGLEEDTTYVSMCATAGVQVTHF